MKIRRFRSSEIPAVHSLLVDNGWSHRIKGIAWLTELLIASQFADVAIHDDKVVGFVRAISDGLSNGYLSMIVVASDHRRQGIGRALVEHVTAGNPHVTWVLRAARDEALAFFSKLGFTTSSVAMKKNRASDAFI